jgi:hypothetical protein
MSEAALVREYKTSLAQTICRIGGIGLESSIILTLTLILSFSANGLSAARPSPQSLGADEAAELVAKVGERLASYPKLESWQARALSTTSYMNSAWKPTKTTTVEKIVTIDGRRRSEDILKAVETERGRTRDVTEKMRAEARERVESRQRPSDDPGSGHGRLEGLPREDNPREDNPRADAERSSSRRRGPNMSADELLPFGPDARSGYDFTIKGASSLDGTPVIVLQSRSRVRSQDKLEGLYYIDPTTYDVLRAELTMAKKPAPLKRMEAEAEFAVLPSGHQVLTRAVMRMHVGLIVKNIRFEGVETYTDHQIR